MLNTKGEKRMFKRSLAIVLATLLLTLKLSGLICLAATNNQDNLKNFLKDKKEVFIKYQYPSMNTTKLATSKICSMVTLPAGTPIVLRNMETINSSNITNGSSVMFTVINDVVVDDKVLIKAGSIVNAQVNYAKKKNYAGVAGEITISDFAAKAVDGTYVPLRATLSSKGEEKMGLSIGLGVVICILFLLIQGDDAVIPAGTTKSVYTIMDVQINTSNT